MFNERLFRLPMNLFEKNILEQNQTGIQALESGETQRNIGS